ncbi:MAG: L,D-transpeptidase family protein [Desulfobacteraceae bacterium]|jgi:murein L,D-transpeptidase YafK
MKKYTLLVAIVLLLLNLCEASTPKADFVLVVKSEKRLYLKRDDKILKSYRVVFGANPEGHKLMEGDQRTPEGIYFLDYKLEKSAFYKAIHISYPNNKDIRKAKELGVDPGGSIMIHGQPNDCFWPPMVTQYFNWTDGCIAVTNFEMDEIWDAVDEGTPIRIMP